MLDELVIGTLRERAAESNAREFFLQIGDGLLRFLVIARDVELGLKSIANLLDLPLQISSARANGFQHD